MIRLTYTYRDSVRIFETDRGSIIIGRPQPGVEIDLDLTPDNMVSRRHTRIWADEEGHWIEDLSSTRGTIVDGIDIRKTGRVRIRGGEVIEVGETVVKVGMDDPRQRARSESLHLTTVPFQNGREDAGTITSRVDAQAPLDLEARARALLYDLPLELGNASAVAELASIIVRRLAEALPRGTRVSLLLLEKSGEHVLAAHVPEDLEPSVSLTLAREAVDRGEAFVWVRGDDPTLSQRKQSLTSGIYAPLLWQRRVIGALSLHRTGAQTFDDENLKLVMGVAHYAAMAIAGRQLEDELRRNALVLERLLTNFSPRVRTRLLEKARHGRLRLGGEKSEVTVLTCDLRGFTQTTSSMDAEVIVDLLNDYFSVLVAALFRFEGTIDKFIGDAVLAVFGSPEPDSAQCEHAVRAAFAIQEGVQSLNERRAAAGQPSCQIGIGIHRGEVLHGFIGTEDRMEFTVIGEAVNRASRYCAGAAGGEIVVSADLYGRIFQVASAEKTSIATKHEGNIAAYRLKALR